MAAGGLICRACVETSLGTRMLVMAPLSSSIAGFKERIKLLHAHSFPEQGEVVVGELMVFLYGFWYTISGDGTLGVALGGADRVKAHVDVVPVVPVVPVARVSRRKRKERDEDMLEVLKEIRSIFTRGIVIGGGGAPLTQQQPKGATQPSSLAAAANKAAAAVVEEAPNLDSVEEALEVDGADEDAVDATAEAVTVLPAKVAVAVPGATQPISVVVEEAPVVDAATQPIQAATVVGVEAEAEADPTQIVLTQKEADADPTQIVLTQKDPAVQPSVGKEASSSAQPAATSKAFAMAYDSEILSPDQFVAKMIKARGGKAKKKNEATRTAFKVRKLVI